MYHVFASRIAHSFLICCTLTAGAACRLEHYDVEDSGPPLFASVDMISTPTGPGSGEPNLTVGPGRRVYLSWLEPGPDSTYALKLSVRQGSRWSTARTIVRDRNLFVNWADFPSVVALDDGRLAAHWLQRTGPGRYSYGVRIVQSTDGGQTWSRPVTPHRPRVESEHGFVSLWPAGGRLGAIWLDGRKYKPTGQTARNEMALVATTIATDGSVGPEVAVDDRVCDCCQTAVAIAERGPVVVYRDRSADEVRDIYVVRHVGGQWLAPKPVHADGWRIDACPVNGPAIAADGSRVVVAWFTAANDTARVQVAFSDDSGETFSLPTRVDNGSPAGRVDVALQADGSALVSWLERTAAVGVAAGQGGEGAEVRVRRVRSDGSLAQWATVARSSAARASGFPHMVATARGEVYFTWTAPGNPSTVRVARAILRRSPEGGA